MPTPGENTWKTGRGKNEISGHFSGAPMRNENEGLARKMIAFAVFLKDRGFRVFQSSIHDALRALEVVGLEDRSDFFFCLRSNLVTTDLEWAQFKTLFDEFWVWREEVPKEETEVQPRPDPDGRNEGEGEECLHAAKSEPPADDKSSDDRE